MTVQIIRQYNLLAITVPDQNIMSLITNNLTYYESVFLRGRDYYIAKRNNLPTVQRKRWTCYTVDVKGRIITSAGFYDRIVSILNSKNIPFEYICKTAHPKPEVFEPHWYKIKKFELRYKQKEALDIIVNHTHGRISCPPGWGKTFVMILTGLLLPKAKIAVVTKRVEVLQQRIYPALCSNLPDVGVVGGGKNKKNHRIMCYTAASLHHAPGDEDLVLFDEGHEAAADGIYEKMARFRHARMFGFSATWDKRLDNKDLRCEALFGPIRLYVDYDEAIRQKMVVPIMVLVRDVNTIDICFNIDPRSVEAERVGIWSNTARNRLIAQDARSYDADTQVLITVKTLEHGLYLKKLLPEYELIYNERGQSEEDWKYFRRIGLIDNDFVPLTRQKREELRAAYEKGELKKVIATPVWNVGVDMRYLQVVIRADAGGSPINDMQIPGRASRILPPDDGLANQIKKDCAIVHDYLDKFNHTFYRKSCKRLKSYKEFNWSVYHVDKRKFIS